MKKKAFFALFLAMVLALSSLAGCAGQTADSKNDSASGKTRPTTKGRGGEFLYNGSDQSGHDL